jgi:hypothetical protein
MGSIGFGMTRVMGSNLLPIPAANITAFLIIGSSPFSFFCGSKRIDNRSIQVLHMFERFDLLYYTVYFLQMHNKKKGLSICLFRLFG